jgi:hypothetical protein
MNPEMDKPTLYMETTIPSYLLAEPSRDVISLGRQDITRTWWKRDHARYAIYVSAVVIKEADKGDPREAEKRRTFLEQFPVLDETPDIQRLIETYLEENIVPVGSGEDAAHLAFASIYKIDFLCTWNFKHLANLRREARFTTVNHEEGYWRSPRIVSPMEMEDESDE